MPVGSQSTEEVDQNYVPMSANSPSHHHSGSLPEPMHEPNYVPMTPSTMEFSSLGKQVPPPAHMGFRSSPKTPPRRPMLSECQPPPVDRNLKPDRKGEKIIDVHACVAVTWFVNNHILAAEVICVEVYCWSQFASVCRVFTNAITDHALSHAAIVTVLAHGHKAICITFLNFQKFSKHCPS